MNKRILSLVLMAISSTAQATSEYYNQIGGFAGPSANAQTVQSIKNSGLMGFFNDDIPVVLQGQIVQSLGGEYYTFRDSTGSITLDIDHDVWFGAPQVTPNTTVIIYGEIDKDFLRTTVDVDTIRLAV